MKPIKLFVVGHSYVVKEYQKALDILAMRNFAVTLFTPKVYKEGGRDVEAKTFSDNIRHYKFNTLLGNKGKQHFHLYLNIFKLIYLFIKNRPDILYLYEEPNSLVTLQFALICRLFCKKTKIIIWTSNDTFRDYKKIYKIYDIRRYLFDFNIQMNSSLTDAAIATSPEAKDVLKKKNYLKKIYITHTHAVDSNFLFPIKKQNKIFTIGFIGRLENQKGLQVVLKAINLLKNKNIDSFRLFIYGEGSKKEEFREFCYKNNLEQNVTWNGFYNYYELNSIMNTFDLLVVPSITEGVVKEKFGRVIIEGMACGIPVIISNSGGMPSVGSEAVKKFEENDYIKLSELIIEFLFDSEQCKKYSQLGIERVEKYFSYKSISDSFNEIFTDLQSNHNSDNEIYINNYRIKNEEDSNINF